MRNDEKCGENKTCGGCFALPNQTMKRMGFFLGNVECHTSSGSHGCWDLDILTQSHHPPHDSASLTLTHRTIFLKHTQAHTCTHCSHKGRTWMFLSPPQQFPFNGPPDNLLFSSVLLVWPLAQSLPQPSTESEDLSAISGGGSSKASKKKREKKSWTFFQVLNLASLKLGVLTNWSMLGSTFYLIRWSLHFHLFVAVVVVFVVISCLWNPRRCCLLAPRSYPSYLLITSSCFSFFLLFRLSCWAFSGFSSGWFHKYLIIYSQFKWMEISYFFNFFLRMGESIFTIISCKQGDHVIAYRIFPSNMWKSNWDGACLITTRVRLKS